MTERAPARRRWSLRRIRLAAWGSVATAFVGLVGVLGVLPKPASAEGANASAERTQARPAATRSTAAKPFVRRTIEVKPHRSVPVKVVEPPPPADATSPPPPSTGGS